MTRQEAEMLKTIMALEFTAVDLNLYLDTHPEDQRALTDFNQVAQQLQGLKAKYEQLFRPLLNYGHASGGHGWAWIEDPWPWEMTY